MKRGEDGRRARSVCRRGAIVQIVQKPDEYAVIYGSAPFFFALADNDEIRSDNDAMFMRVFL